MATVVLRSFSLFLSPTPSASLSSRSFVGRSLPRPPISRSWRHRRPSAIVEDLGRQSSSTEDRSVDLKVLIPNEEAASEEAPAAEVYDWREEWYPLYLTANLPDDAPLGLTVFDKQIVVYKDGAGVIRCYEDRCPHR